MTYSIVEYFVLNRITEYFDIDVKKTNIYSRSILQYVLKKLYTYQELFLNPANEYKRLYMYVFQKFLKKTMTKWNTILKKNFGFKAILRINETLQAETVNDVKDMRLLHLIISNDISLLVNWPLMIDATN